MIDIKKEQIPAYQLELGMFIVELDKPWIESDFLMQGFLLEDQADLNKMRSTCEHVFIDRTKSTGNQFSAKTKIDTRIKRKSTVRIKAPIQQDRKNTPVMNKARQGEKVSFMDILREVRGYQKPKNKERSGNEGTVFNMRSGNDTALQTALPLEGTETPTTQNSDGVLNSIGGFVNSLLSREKFKNPIKNIFNDNNKSTLSHLSEEEKIIYEQEPPVEEEIAAIYPVYEQSQTVTRDVFDAIANEHHVDISSVSDALDSMVESIGRTPDALLWLAKLKKADGNAYNLALNVSITLMAFNSFLGLSKEQIKLSGLAGLLQDIGKVKLSSDVLLKKGKLTKEEYEYAKKHVDESIKILKETPDISQEIIQVVAEHHERVDGSGYPLQLTGNQLTLLSQAAGLIDTYCAMTNNRSYAEGAYNQQALDQIHALSGKQFSKEIIDQLIQFMGIYPVSSLVELNTGEVGVVIQQNQVRRLLPRVMLLLDPEKERYTAPIVLELIHRPETAYGELYNITKGIPADSYGLNPSDFYI
ncbi:MAG: HD-GYP domain-containing protein [Methylophilaceae bacterium]